MNDVAICRPASRPAVPMKEEPSAPPIIAVTRANVPLSSTEKKNSVIVRNHRRSEDHMVVAVYDEDAWFILCAR
jgi:hypothetical protein